MTTNTPTPTFTPSALRLKTWTCQKCRFETRPATPNKLALAIGRHRQFCDRLPDIPVLIAEWESGKAMQELADYYEVKAYSIGKIFRRWGLNTRRTKQERGEGAPIGSYSKAAGVCAHCGVHIFDIRQHLPPSMAGLVFWWGMVHMLGNVDVCGRCWEKAQ